MDVHERAERLRKALEVAVAPRGRRHFSEPLMREATAYLAARAADGVGADTVGQEIGLAANTLRRWQKLFGRTTPPTTTMASASPPTFVPLTVVAAPTSSAPALVVRGPHGVCIEGLDLAALADLLRRLA